jgi:hypothetical protein
MISRIFAATGSPGYNLIMLKIIDVTGLPDPLVLAIESLVNTYREQANVVREGEARPLGWLKGQLEIPDSFFDPLPDDVLNAFNGEAERA